MKNNCLGRVAMAVVFIGQWIGLSMTAAYGQPQPDSVVTPEAPSTATPSLRQTESILQDLRQVPLIVPEVPPTGSDANTASPALLTSATPSATTFTIPSLWWQQVLSSAAIGTNRLVVGWIAHPRGSDSAAGLSSEIPDLAANPINLNYIDLIVDSQIWDLLNYLEQYAFLSQFGQTATDYRYQLRVFSGEILIGTYVCDFNTARLPVAIATASPNADPLDCSVSLNYLGRNSIRGRTSR